MKYRSTRVCITALNTIDSTITSVCNRPNIISELVFDRNKKKNRYISLNGSIYCVTIILLLFIIIYYYFVNISINKFN